jgi:hypothetical protein
MCTGCPHLASEIRACRGPAHPADFALTIEIFKSSADSTPVNVSSVGFPRSDSGRYSVSRCTPDSFATFDILVRIIGAANGS